jgi:hypothetical protein
MISTPTNHHHTDILLLEINFERRRTQLMLTENSLIQGDNNMARCPQLYYTAILHTLMFPSIGNILENTGNANSTKKLESVLSDLTFTIKSGNTMENVNKNLAYAKNLLNNTPNQLSPFLKSGNGFTIVSQTAEYLLGDAEESYQLSNAAILKSSLGQKSEINLLFTQLQNHIAKKSD